MEQYGPKDSEQDVITEVTNSASGEGEVANVNQEEGEVANGNHREGEVANGEDAGNGSEIANGGGGNQEAGGEVSA